MTSSLRLLPALLCLSAFACEGGPGAGPPIPLLEVAPGELDWGEVDAEDAAPKMLELRSIGTDVLRIDAAELQDASFVLLGIDPSGARLAPGEALSLSIAPSARRDSLLESVLTVQTNAGEPVDVPLYADLRAPIGNLTPSSWDFGTRNVLCEVERGVVLTNSGRAALRIDALFIDEGTGGANWSLGDAPEVGEELAAGGQADFVVRFESRDPEQAAAALVLQSNDPEQPEIEVPLTGRGRLGGEAAETFAVQVGADGVFLLASPAAPFTVQVRVDGTRTFQGWRHDEERQAVVFEAAFLPEAGSSVGVTYRRGGC